MPLQGDHQSRTGLAGSSAIGIGGITNPQAVEAANDQKMSSINAESAGVAPKMEGRDALSAELHRQQLEEERRLVTENQDGFSSLSDEEESDDEEEEPLIIQLMESMFTRKKTVQESEQMISEISVEAIRQEIRRLALEEKCR